MLFFDSIDSATVIRDRPSGLHQSIQQYFLRLFRIDNTYTTESLGIDSSGDGILCFAHFTIDGNGLGVGSTPFTVFSSFHPTLGTATTSGEVSFLSLLRVIGAVISGVFASLKNSILPFETNLGVGG